MSKYINKALADKIMLMPYVIFSSLGFLDGIFSVGSQYYSDHMLYIWTFVSYHSSHFYY